MSREMGIILLGVAVIIVPYLGVPSAWRTFLLVVAGITLIVIGFLLRAQGLSRPERSSPHRPFVESLPGRQAGDAAGPTLAHDPQHDHKEGITSLN